MTMFASQWLANPSTGYTIDQSIRFNDNDSAYLTRTPGSASNRKTWTISTWVKYSVDTASGSAIFGSGATSAEDTFAYITSGGAIDWIVRDSSTIRGRIVTNRLFRDPSAWYHLVFVLDTTSGTAGDRMRLWVNGSEETSFSTDTNPPVNTDSAINSTLAQYIGFSRGNGGDNLWDGYQAEIQLVDGTALNASSFGEYNADGVWVPKKYTNAAGYGTNGFYITGATASDLGEDFSGNNNDYTSSGLATTDQMLDTPTANLPTFNPLSKGSGTLSDGNLQYVGVGSWTNVRLNLLLPETGKWAVRFKTVTSYQQIMVGVCAPDSATTYGDLDANGVAMLRYNTQDGNFVTRVGGSRIADTGPPTVAAQTYFQLLFDMDAGLMGVAADGATSGTFADISTYSIMDLQGASLSTARQIFALVYSGSGASGAGAILDAGQSGWEPTVTGFSALTLANLATPSITDGSAYFQPTLYEGNGSTQSIDQDGNSTFKPDWVWIKNRDAADQHALFDVVRGATELMGTNVATAEATNDDTLTAFESDGFAVGDDVIVNTNNESYVAWQWLAGNNSTGSNTDGSINTTATTVNTTAGFSISTYTGNATVGATVGHGLGIAPKVVIVKSRSNTENWIFGHDSVGWNKAMYMSSTGAPFTLDIYWNNTAPTSSVVELHDHPVTNGSGYTYVMYSFAEIPGYSSFGIYEANASTDGPFVYTGFKPSFVLIKNIDAAEDWWIQDDAREPFNGGNMARLAPNSSAAEADNVPWFDFLSNGLKVRYNAGGINASGTHIYMAFAENPFGGDGVAAATAR